MKAIGHKHKRERQRKQIRNRERGRERDWYECWKRLWHLLQRKSLSGKPISPHKQQTVSRSPIIILQSLLLDFDEADPISQT